MSHAYAHTIFENEPGKWYFACDDVIWDDEVIAEMDDWNVSSKPRGVGGPFTSRDEATEVMCRSYGNPGFTNTAYFSEVKAEGEYYEKMLAGFAEKAEARASQRSSYSFGW